MQHWPCTEVPALAGKARPAKQLRRPVLPGATARSWLRSLTPLPVSVTQEAGTAVPAPAKEEGATRRCGAPSAMKRKVFTVAQSINLSLSKSEPENTRREGRPGLVTWPLAKQAQHATLDSCSRTVFLAFVIEWPVRCGGRTRSGSIRSLGLLADWSWWVGDGGTEWTTARNQ